MRRSLTLKRELLAELSAGELCSVHGGEALPTGEGRCPTLPLDCVWRLTAQLVQDSLATCVTLTCG